MTIKIEQAEGRALQEELEFFIKGEISREVELRDTNMCMHPMFTDNVLTFFHLLCKGNLSLEKSSCKKPCDWLQDQGWEDIVKLAELFPEQFGSLPNDVEIKSADWKSVSEHSDTGLTSDVLINWLRV